MKKLLQKNEKRILAFGVALMLALSVFFAAFFLAEEIEHDCSGEECPICECIQNCEALLLQVGTGLAVVFLCVIPVLHLVARLSDFSYFLFIRTLVSNKIRLNI